jgi:hypothetical protein
VRKELALKGERKEGKERKAKKKPATEPVPNP